MKPRVSVVMSVFNGEHHLCEAIESILDQTERNFEFIIIDDGSTDDSSRLLENYRRTDSRVRLITQPNRGLIYSLNRGCELARAPYIARMDADDVALPWRLERQIEFMETSPDVALLGGAADFIDTTGRLLCTFRPPTRNEQIQELLLDASVFVHPTAIFRTELFRTLGGYRRVIHAEDYDLWLRFAERSKVANLNEVVLRYRVHPGQTSVRWFRQQALGAIAVRTAALARRAGKADPLASGREVTEEFIGELGVTDSEVQTELARACLSSARNLALTGDYARAFELLEDLPPSQLTLAKKWVLADLYLAKARIQWHRGRLSRGMLSAMRGVIERPSVLGRPIKRLSAPLTARLAHFTQPPNSSL